MTITEYLADFKALKIESNSLYNKALETSNRATSIKSSLDLGDGIAHQKSVENGSEIKMLALSDAIGNYKKAAARYKARKDEMRRAINKLYYWEGVIIEELYIYDVIADRHTDLMEFSEMLETTNRQEIKAKAAQAREHLRQILIEQGLEIE